MSSNSRHPQNLGQQYGHNPPQNFGSEGWMTDPFALAPSANGASAINDVGTGQQSSYQERTYTLPGGYTYYESSG